MRSLNRKMNSSKKGNTGLIFIGVGACLLLALMTYVAGRGLGDSKKEVEVQKNVEVTITKKTGKTVVSNEVVKVANMVEKPANERPSLSVTILEETNMPSIVMPKDGDIVSIHYQGLFEDGKEFDSSYKRNEPLNFQVGAGRMIQGMDQGVKMIPIGAKAKLSIPWHLAYGEHGRPGIPPKANLIFVMEVLEVMPKPAPHVFPKPDGSKAKTLGDLKYWVLKAGNGPKPKQGQSVKVHYTGWFESGKSFDSSKKRGMPFKFNLGGRVIKGWNQMVANMSKGESVFVSIPSHLAYGPYGRGGIPGGATLLFQIDLLDFK